MSNYEIKKLINSFFAFVCSACLCGFIFYAIASTGSFHRYKPLVVGFGSIFFISSLITIFVVFKYGSLLTFKYLDDREIEQEKGLTAGNYLGLLGVSILNVIIFNPFYPIPGIFEHDVEDSYNQAYSFMVSLLILTSILFYYSRQQIKEVTE